MFSDDQESDDLSSPSKQRDRESALNESGPKTESAPHTERDLPRMGLKERSITLAPQKMNAKDLLKVEKAEDEVSEFSYHSYGSAADFKTLQK